MRTRLALVVAPILLLTLLPGAASAAPPPDTQAAYHARVIAHWTPARMRAAVPRDFTFDAVRGFQPAAKPGGGGTGTVTGASWTGGGKMLTTTGKVYFEMGGSGWICSGSVVNDTATGRSVILTAGHCVVENDGTFATYWMFIPEFDSAPTYTCSAAKYGCWVADYLYASRKFAYAGGFNNTAVQYDWGFAVTSGGAQDARPVDQVVGSFAIGYSGVAKNDVLSAFGYPAAGKYHGSDLTYCVGPIGTDAGTGNTTWSMACDMTGGSSGGPWVKGSGSNYASAVLSSLNSYGYSGVKKMYGPMFNANTRAVFDAANGLSVATSTTPFVRVALP